MKLHDTVSQKTDTYIYTCFLNREVLTLSFVDVSR